MGGTVHQEILWRSVEKISVGLVLCLVCSALIWLGDNETLVGGFHMNQVRNAVVFLVATKGKNGIKKYLIGMITIITVTTMKTVMMIETIRSITVNVI